MFGNDKAQPNAMHFLLEAMFSSQEWKKFINHNQHSAPELISIHVSFVASDLNWPQGIRAPWSNLLPDRVAISASPYLTLQHLGDLSWPHSWQNLPYSPALYLGVYDAYTAWETHRRQITVIRATGLLTTGRKKRQQTYEGYVYALAVVFSLTIKHKYNRVMNHL